MRYEYGTLHEVGRSTTMGWIRQYRVLRRWSREFSSPVIMGWSKETLEILLFERIFLGLLSNSNYWSHTPRKSENVYVLFVANSRIMINSRAVIWTKAYYSLVPVNSSFFVGKYDRYSIYWWIFGGLKAVASWYSYLRSPKMLPL